MTDKTYPLWKKGVKEFVNHILGGGYSHMGLYNAPYGKRELRGSSIVYWAGAIVTLPLIHLNFIISIYSTYTRARHTTGLPTSSSIYQGVRGNGACILQFYSSVRGERKLNEGKLNMVLQPITITTQKALDEYFDKITTQQTSMATVKDVIKIVGIEIVNQSQYSTVGSWLKKHFQKTSQGYLVPDAAAPIKDIPWIAVNTDIVNPLPTVGNFRELMFAYGYPTDPAEISRLCASHELYAPDQWQCLPEIETAAVKRNLPNRLKVHGPRKYQDVINFYRINQHDIPLVKLLIEWNLGKFLPSNA